MEALETQEHHMAQVVTAQIPDACSLLSAHCH